MPPAAPRPKVQVFRREDSARSSGPRGANNFPARGKRPKKEYLRDCKVRWQQINHGGISIKEVNQGLKDVEPGQPIARQPHTASKKMECCLPPSSSSDLCGSPSHSTTSARIASTFLSWRRLGTTLSAVQQSIGVDVSFFCANSQRFF